MSVCTAFSTPDSLAANVSDFKAARDALVGAIRSVFPDARPVEPWAGVEAWGAPRPASVVDEDAPGTYDPKLTVIGIADRKSGPVIYFLDPGDYFALETQQELLKGAGFKLGRGCIMHTRKGPLPVEALEELFRRTKARDSQRGGVKPSRAKRSAKKASASKPAEGRAPNAAVARYLARLPADQRVALERLRGQVLAAAPDATEKIGYGIPTFVHHGNLVHMAAFKDHCSFFPGSAAVTSALADGLRGFKTAKGTIQFTPKKPLPAALVKRIVKARVAENEAKARAPRRKGGKNVAARATRSARAR